MKKIILIAVFVASGIAAWASNHWPTTEDTFPPSVYPTSYWSVAKHMVQTKTEPSWPVEPSWPTEPIAHWPVN